MDIKLAEFPDWTGLETIESKGSFWDTQELSNLNNTLIRTTINLKEINRQLTNYERERTLVDLEYKHKFREMMVNSTVKTETQKKKLAELACEEYEFKIAYLDEVIRELNRMSQGLRVDLDILKTLSYNLRQEMRII